jgi:hypothetical protein
VEERHGKVQSANELYTVVSCLAPEKRKKIKKVQAGMSQRSHYQTRPTIYLNTRLHQLLRLEKKEQNDLPQRIHSPGPFISFVIVGTSQAPWVSS